MITLKESQIKIIHELEAEFGSITNVNESNDKLIELRKSFGASSSRQISKKIIDDIHKYTIKPELQTTDKTVVEVSEMLANGYNKFDIMRVMRLSEGTVASIIQKNKLRKNGGVWTVIDGKTYENRNQKMLKNMIHEQTKMTWSKMNELPYYQIIDTRKAVLVGDE